LEAGMAEKASVLTAGTITQEDSWGSDVNVKPTEKDDSDYFWVSF
jgi:hypothetical protein